MFFVRKRSARSSFRHLHGSPNLLFPVLHLLLLYPLPPLSRRQPFQHGRPGLREPRPRHHLLRGLPRLRVQNLEPVGAVRSHPPTQTGRWWSKDREKRGAKELYLFWRKLQRPEGLRSRSRRRHNNGEKESGAAVCRIGCFCVCLRAEIDLCKHVSFRR